MIDEKEISIRWHSGTGAGGQHRNRTQNCCEITHLPTGFKAVGTESRSRQDNKKAALERLEKKLADKTKVEAATKMNAARKAAAENGRIRTYDFGRGLVTDHRSGKTADMGRFMDGKVDLASFSQK